MASVKERGQLLLVGGLALAVSLVVIALVLNSAIYTENLATRNSDTTDETGLELTREVQADGGDVLSTVNRRSPFTYNSLNSRYGQAFSDVVAVQRRSGARSGRSVEVVAGTRELGTRIRDDGSGDPSFVPADTSGYDALTARTDDWAVVQNAKVRSFKMTVTNTGSLPTTSPTDPTSLSDFFIEIRDSSGPEIWQIVPYEDPSGNLGIFVYEKNTGTIVGSCTPEVSGGITLGITDGTVEGVPCSALSFVENLGSTQDVYYVQAQEGEGEYEIVVDRVMETPAAVATGFPFESAVDQKNYDRHCAGPTYEETTSGEPFAVPALYATDIDMSYRTSEVTYEHSVRVVPDEPGDRTRHPRIQRFDVDDGSGSDAQFTVTWSTVDPEGGSPSVVVQLVDASGTIQDTTSSSGSTLTDPGGGGSTYTLQLEADDGSNIRTITETHTADGDSTGDNSCPE